jgi:hypothetical protein
MYPQRAPLSSTVDRPSVGCISSIHPTAPHPQVDCPPRCIPPSPPRLARFTNSSTIPPCRIINARFVAQPSSSSWFSSPPAPTPLPSPHPSRSPAPHQTLRPPNLLPRPHQPRPPLPHRPHHPLPQRPQYSNRVLYHLPPHRALNQPALRQHHRRPAPEIPSPPERSAPTSVRSLAACRPTRPASLSSLTPVKVAISKHLVPRTSSSRPRCRSTTDLRSAASPSRSSSYSSFSSKPKEHSLSTTRFRLGCPRWPPYSLTERRSPCASSPSTVLACPTMNMT